MNPDPQNRKLVVAIATLITAACSAWAQTPPGGGSTSTAPTYYATYKLDGGTSSQSNQAYTATATDTSAIWVTNSGVLTLISPTVKTSGNTSSQDSSSFYGLNAGLLANAAGAVTVTGGTITTTGTGANGAFATGTGSTVTLSGVTINASADGGHAVMATQAGILKLTDVTMVTSGGSSSAIATDRGGGTITVSGGNVTTSGNNSAGIYSTGSITVTGTTFKSTGAELAVIEGANSIVLKDCNFTGTKEKWGVLLYQSMSGDAEGTKNVFTMTGGSLNYTPSSGPMFYNTNSNAVITLSGVTITSNSGVLLKAAAGSWGSSGSNGGTSVLIADAQTLTGNVVVDSISTLTATLKNGSSLTGAINAEKTAKSADLTLDSSSKWTVTANSYLSSIVDAAGISGTSITNIAGNGNNVYYDATLSANSYLGGKVYTLVNGGSLLPAGSVTTSTPTITAEGVKNGASFVAGIAPAAWISIFGTNLATTTDTVTTSGLVNGSLPATFGGTTVTINGKSAYMYYVSPTQINVQAPNDTTTGSVTVMVTNSAGSASQSVTMASVMPGLFAASNYVLAVRPSDSTIINGTGAAASGYVTAAAAKPGDVLEIYGTGFGATVTAVAPGLVFSGAYATTSTPTVTIGGTTAEVSYSGLVGTGLYQINVKVPASLAAGTHAVVVTQNGVRSPSTAMLKVESN